ncbi:MAG TPA: hypothetical protein VMJ10_09145 [Kofleriaceae bacterium]|nr:hypothetical protein [Kofleriaceae bacterium]
MATSWHFLGLRWLVLRTRSIATPRSRLLALALALTLVSCGGPQRRPVIAAAVAGAAIGFGTCEIDNVDSSKCALIGGTAAVALGGIAAIITLLVDTNAHELQPDDEDIEEWRKAQGFTPPPPGLPDDAGIADAAPPDVQLDAHAIDAPSIDAGVAIDAP